MLLTGLRGVGKTVLLNEIERMAKKDGYHTIAIEAHEDKPLGILIAPYLRTLLYDLDRMAGVGDKVKRGLAVLRSFIGWLKVTVKDITFGLDIDPEKGAADSGDLEIDLPNLLVAIGEAAENRSSAVAIFIDEVQYFSQKELAALIMAMHKVQQQQLPVVLLGAGLPILPGLAGESKSYAERLFSFPEVGHFRKLTPQKPFKTLQKQSGPPSNPLRWRKYFILRKDTRTSFKNGATSHGIGLLQVLLPWKSSGKLRPTSFRASTGISFACDSIALHPVKRAFCGRWPAWDLVLHRTGDIAETLKVKAASLGPVRAKLIKKGMIYSPAYGDIAFTVPLFDEFMVRAIPDFKP